MSAPDPTPLATRYGTARRAPRWALPLVAAVLLGSLTAFAAWAAWSSSTRPGATSLRSFAPAERSVEVTFTVRKPSDRSAVCTVRAYGLDDGEVGRAAVTVPPGRSVTTVTVGTRSRPYTVQVDRCRLRG